MKSLLVTILLVILPSLAMASGKPAEKAAAAVPAPGLFRLTPEEFQKHPPAQRLLDRAKLDHGLLSAAIFHATNQQRTRHQLPPFLHSDAVQRAAQGHSRDMAAGGFFSHQNPRDPTRKTMKERLALEGITKGLRTKNIAKTPVQGHTYLTAAEAIVAQWMASRGHRRNILDRSLRYLGCGAHVDPASPHFYILATQDFAASVPE